MAYTTINKSTDYFNTKIYTGDGTSSQAITGVGFQSDLTWIKRRDTTNNHRVTDAVRGVTKEIYPDDSSAQDTRTNGLTAFSADGFTLGGSAGYNANNGTYASWNWKANGAGSANTDGSINTASTSVNTTAGFSISTYTGNQTSGASVGHGLGVAPKMIIVKNFTTSDAHAWRVYHKSLGATKELYLNLSNAPYTATNIWNDQEPTSSVFYLGNNDSGTNKSGVNYVAYCFAEKKGYSRFGSYLGNGNADGTFVYTGFKPAFVMIKETSDTGNWCMSDNKRDGYNPTKNIYADSNGSENTANTVDHYSNGFKIRSTGGSVNTSGSNMIYMAFAEAPLVGTNGVTAKAR